MLEERSFGMEVTKKPKIKSIPYEEFTDNETLEKLVRELNAGGAMSPLAYWTISSTGDAATHCGLLRLQPCCCGIEFMALGAAATIWRASGSR